VVERCDVGRLPFFIFQQSSAYLSRFLA